MENLESVTRRIQKLLAIAGDSRSNPEEASAAAGMATRIMRKYQLEHSDIILESLRKGDDMHSEDCLATAKTNGTRIIRVPAWASWIGVSVAKINECGVKYSYTQSGDVALRFYGFKQDVMVAKYTFEYLITTLLKLCDEFKKSSNYSGRSSISSYRKGVSSGICYNLDKLAEQKKKENQDSSTGTALVIAKSHAIVEYGGEFKTKESKATDKIDSAFIIGVHHGNDVDINRRALENNSSSTVLLT